jgi:predicted dinucleotide-binding enzyme
VEYAAAKAALELLDEECTAHSTPLLVRSIFRWLPNAVAVADVVVLTVPMRNLLSARAQAVVKPVKRPAPS